MGDKGKSGTKNDFQAQGSYTGWLWVSSLMERKPALGQSALWQGRERVTLRVTPKC